MLYSGKDLRKLIIPLIIEQILAIAVGMADTIMVSAAGEAAVSGVSLVDTVNILLINVFSALATGGAVVSGHFLGKKKREDACKSAWQILLFATLLAFVISVIFICKCTQDILIHNTFYNYLLIKTDLTVTLVSGQAETAVVTAFFLRGNFQICHHLPTFSVEIYTSTVS